MSLKFSSCSFAPALLPINQLNVKFLQPQKFSSSNLSLFQFPSRPAWCCPRITKKINESGKLVTTQNSTAVTSTYAQESNITTSIDWEGDEGDVEEDIGSPWEGAIIYKRNSSISHVEYCTTLERLGLGSLSTETSKSRASVMGLRVTKAVKDYPNGTPVQVSIDVIRKKQKLRLDGIVRTVITLGCNRCGEPAAECVFSNFALLLSEQPIEEPEVIDIGAIFGDDEVKSSSREGESDDDGSIDWDDRLYFPLEQKEIDISKNIRDLVHLEITINAICDANCKGLCLKCGANLNTSSCTCKDKQEIKEKVYGPLGNLRKQMERK